MIAIHPVAPGQLYDAAGHRKYLTEAEWRSFLRAADRLPPAPRTLCYFLAYTGCRLSEALALTGPQCDFARHTVTLRTLKRRRPHRRTLPIPASVSALLQRLPRTVDGTFWDMHRVTAWRLVKDVMRQARIRGPMASPKGLRHGFGMRAAAQNVPISLIQRWLGHASPTTTAMYLDAVGDEERGFASRLWPAVERPISVLQPSSAPWAAATPDALEAALREILSPVLAAYSLAPAASPLPVKQSGPL